MADSRRSHISLPPFLVDALPGMKPGTLKVLIVLCEQRNYSTNLVSMSQRSLGYACGLSDDRYVAGAIAELHSLDLISTTRSAGAGRGRCAEWLIHFTRQNPAHGTGITESHVDIKPGARNGFNSENPALKPGAGDGIHLENPSLKPVMRDGFCVENPAQNPARIPSPAPGFNSGIRNSISISEEEKIARAKIETKPEHAKPRQPPPVQPPERHRQAAGAFTMPETPAKPQQPQVAGIPSAADANNDPADSDNVFAFAVEAFDQWSALPHPVGRGRKLEASNNELTHVRRLIDRVAQMPGIPRGGSLMNRALLIGLAADALRIEGVIFKAPGYAAGCVFNRLDQWAGVGAADSAVAPAAKPARLSYSQQDDLERAAKMERVGALLREEQEGGK